MNKLIAASLVTLAACGSKSAPAPTTAPVAPAPVTEAAEPVASAPAPGPAHGKPEIGAWGFDVKGMNAKVTPGDSFYEYANGSWLEVDADPGRQVELRHVHRAVATGATSAPRRSSSARSSRRARREEDRRLLHERSWTRRRSRRRGSSRSKPDLDAIAKIKDSKGLVRAFADNSRHGRDERRSRPASARTTRTPRRYIAGIGQGGLGLPDRDMYDAKNKQFEPLRDGYKKYLATMLGDGRHQGRRQARRRGLRARGEAREGPLDARRRTATRRRPTTS